MRCSTTVLAGAALIAAATQAQETPSLPIQDRPSPQPASGRLIGDVAEPDWSAEDRAAFRRAARQAWEEWAARAPETRRMAESQTRFFGRGGPGGMSE